MRQSRLRLLPILLLIAHGCGKLERPSSDKQGGSTTQVSKDTDTPKPPSPAMNDLSLLQGEWTIVEAKRDGADYPSEVGGTGMIEGHVVTAKTTDGVVMKYEIKIDPLKDPKTIDWTPLEGEHREPLLGLYRIDGDTLENCSPPAFGVPRPTEFDTKPGDGRWVFKLKRNPPKQTP